MERYLYIVYVTNTWSKAISRMGGTWADNGDTTSAHIDWQGGT